MQHCSEQSVLSVSHKVTTFRYLEAYTQGLEIQKSIQTVLAYIYIYIVYIYILYILYVTLLTLAFRQLPGPGPSQQTLYVLIIYQAHGGRDKTEEVRGKESTDK